MAFNPVKFANETRAEIAKVVWPTRREVVMTTETKNSVSAP